MPARARRSALVACLALAVLVPPAQAARGAEVCAHRATLYSAPGGHAVGVVRRGDVVTVLSEGGRWWRVKARFGTRGWMRARLVCAEDR